MQLIFGYVKAMSHHSFLLKLLIALREIGCERLLWGRPQTDRFWPIALVCHPTRLQSPVPLECAFLT